MNEFTNYTDCQQQIKLLKTKSQKMVINFNNHKMTIQQIPFQLKT